MISARALCFDMKPNLCLLRLSSTQHNAPEFHDTKEIEFKARGGPGLLGMPKIMMEPCGAQAAPLSHSNCRKAYVSGLCGSQRGPLPSPPEVNYIYGDAPSLRRWELWPALVQLSLSPQPPSQLDLRRGPAARRIENPLPACPSGHTPAIISERAPIK